MKRIKEDFLVGYLKNITRFVACMTALIAGTVVVAEGSFGRKFAVGMLAFFCFCLALIPISVLTRKEICFDDDEIGIGSALSKRKILRAEIESLEYNAEEQVLTIGYHGELIVLRLKNYPQKGEFLDYLS